MARLKIFFSPAASESFAIPNMISDDDLTFKDAVSRRRYEDVERLFPRVNRCVSREYITGNDFNPLHYASSIEIVKFFISKGIDVNVRNVYTDETPLLTVIKLNKSPDVVRELLKHGASIEARNKHTLNTPLNQATTTRMCWPETVQILLEHGAVINTANKYCDTPLHNACGSYSDDVRIVELLIKSGSPVNFRNLAGDSPLNIALRNPFCSGELVKVLLKSGAKVNEKTFLDAVRPPQIDCQSVLPQLVQCASITAGDQWASILNQLLKCTKNDQRAEDWGKLLIMHSFLQCDDPHTPLITCFQKLKESFFLLRIRHSHRPYLLRNSVRKPKSDTCSVSGHLKSFTDLCFSDVERMKTDMLASGISVYEFLKSETNKVRLDVKILKILKENTYPVYAEMILNKIKRSALLDKLMMYQIYTVVQHGDDSRKVILDVFAVSNIAKYLNEDEIKNFMVAFCDPSRDEYCFWDNLVEIEADLPDKPQFRHSSKKKSESPADHPTPKVQKKCSPRI